LPAGPAADTIFFVRWCVLLVASVVGCAGARPVHREEKSSEVSETKAQLRRDRRMIRSLENEVALLRARLRDTQPPPPVTDGETPPPTEAAPPSYEPPSEPIVNDTLGGISDEEVEVVYEGEAAAPATSARPRIESYERTYSEPPAAAPIGEVPSEPGRLPVLAGEIPTVQAQLRRARAAPAAPPRARAPSSDPRADYQRYLDAARAGNHVYASQGLRAFIEQHPAHELSDNAQYWLAETHYGRKQYPLALIEFEKVVKRYPRGNKLPDALLKIGYCHAQLGKRAAARDVLRRLIRSYPNSSPAALARAKLEELGPP
jgi:tol-pal system protein YbgF